MAQRLISADDHVDLSHDTSRRYLDPKFHDDYDDARRGASASSMKAWRRRGEPALARAARPERPERDAT